MNEHEGPLSVDPNAEPAVRPLGKGDRVRLIRPLYSEDDRRTKHREFGRVVKETDAEWVRVKFDGVTSSTDVYRSWLERIDTPPVLISPRRQSVIDALSSGRATPVKDIASATGIPIRYLRKLLVDMTNDGQIAHPFYGLYQKMTSDTVPTHPPVTGPVMSVQRAAILAALESGRNLSTSDLAAETGIDGPALAKYLAALIDDRRIERVARGLYHRTGAPSDLERENRDLKRLLVFLVRAAGGEIVVSRREMEQPEKWEGTLVFDQGSGDHSLKIALEERV